ncbi:hypothetical protein [Streptomyces sp. KL116D]|uniref:hypothetical protein n=1 Tax=Streptomyces sp. KL116D TaxID=3045152 RepID=UPI003558A543
MHPDKVVYKPIFDGGVRLANPALRRRPGRRPDGARRREERADRRQAPALQLALSSATRASASARRRNTRGLGKKPERSDTPLASDVRVREAFDLAIDRDLIKVVFQGM